ncbi:MAG: 1-acyl-sn-glycerol-3-phosphate acyltransferase [Pseudomonadales bacterium]|nr:1-acyl-sn-glycerol-3-phosphate acyltransferase [Pseudomonadales bacterium]
MNHLQLSVRAGLFYASYALLSLVYFIFAALFISFFDFHIRCALMIYWSKICLFCTRYLCGIRYNVTGLENLPKDQPYVVLSKHQSQWETYFLMQLLSPVSIICKKELLKIPGFGYCLSLIKPIAIDRSQPRQALKDIQNIGFERLTIDKVPVLVFPEGTRTDIGKTNKYARGGAALAIKAGVPVVFISHNAGYCWPSGQFIKYPGMIDIFISKPVSSENITALELTNKAEQWIESHVAYHSEADKPVSLNTAT